MIASPPPSKGLAAPRTYAGLSGTRPPCIPWSDWSEGGRKRLASSARPNADSASPTSGTRVARSHETCDVRRQMPEATIRDT